jgi:hypothetical protein
MFRNVLEEIALLDIAAANGLEVNKQKHLEDYFDNYLNIPQLKQIVIIDGTTVVEATDATS